MPLFDKLIRRRNDGYLGECGRFCPLAHLDHQYSKYASDEQQPQLRPIPISDSNAFYPAPQGIYQPLLKSQTRIVELLPGLDGDQLCCYLWVANLISGEGVTLPELAEDVTYECLSYSWGYGGSRTVISCNRQPLVIQSSLAEALLYLRLPDESRMLWCDAICINQADADEKAMQVQQMMLTFEKAAHIIGWIGTPPRQGLCIPGPEYWAAAERLLHEYGKDAHAVAKVAHTEACMSGLESLVAVLSQYLSKGWFTRTWIRQEVFAADALYLQCGYRILDFQDFVDIITWVRTLGGPSNDDTSRQRQVLQQICQQLEWSTITTFDIMTKDYRLRGTKRYEYTTPRFRESLAFNWFRTLAEGSRFNVTDPRDRIYAMLGMMQHESLRIFVDVSASTLRFKFPVVYGNQSVSRTYQNLIKFIINLTKNLAILLVVEDRSQRSMDAPSWVIDWNVRKPRGAHLLNFVSLNYPKTFPEALPQDLDEEGYLFLSGKILTPDVVNFVSAEDERRPDHPMNGVQTRKYLVEQVGYATVKDWSLGYEVGKKKLKVDLLVQRGAMQDRRDILVALDGSMYPVVLRDYGDGTYGYLGPAYPYAPPQAGKFYMFDHMVNSMQLLPWQSDREFVIV